jgi:hypothetical protein
VFEPALLFQIGINHGLVRTRPEGLSQAKEDHSYSYNGVTSSQEKEEERCNIEDKTDHQLILFPVLVGKYPGGYLKYINNYPSNRK